MPPRSSLPSPGVEHLERLVSSGKRELLSALVPREAESGSERVACEHADRCGGCPLIGLPYGEQLAIKRGRVVASMARYEALELVYTEPVASADPILEYRSRARLIVASDGRMGLYSNAAFGHQVVDIPRCRVLAPALAAVAAILRARIAADSACGGPLAPFDPASGGALRALELREVHGAGGLGVLVTLVLERSRAPDRDSLEDAARALVREAPSVVGVAVNLHDGDTQQILGSESVVLHGPTVPPDRVGETPHQATYGSFVHAHRGQAERVRATLVEVLGVQPSEAGSPVRILDLYGGSGTVALGLALAGADVLFVGSIQAAQLTEEAARRQGLRLRTEASEITAALRGLIERNVRFDAVVVSPSRRGMTPLARDLLSRLEVQTLAYVSCDPDTLARDLDHFARLGLAVTTLRPFDMTPLTDEVDTLAILRRAEVPVPKVVYDDDEIFIVEKSAHEPTTPEVEYASSLVLRAHRLPGASEAVPVNRVDVGTSGLVLFVKSADFVARWEAILAMETSRKIYVAGARGVTPSKGAVSRELRDEGKIYPARTRYRRLAVANGHSVLRVVPEQGRTHQIRRHLAAIGHPVLGDDRYGHGPTNRFFEEKNALDRTFLHCVRLEFDHPTQHQRMIVEATMPGDLRAVLERTSGPGTLRFLEQKNALGQSGQSSIPPPPDTNDSSNVLDVNSSTSSLHPEPASDEDLGGRG